MTLPKLAQLPVLAVSFLARYILPSYVIGKSEFKH